MCCRIVSHSGETVALAGGGRPLPEELRAGAGDLLDQPVRVSDCQPLRACQQSVSSAQQNKLL